MSPQAAPDPNPLAAAAAVISLPVDRAAAGPDLRDSLAAIVELTKPRITRLVTITAAVGFVLAALGRRWQPLELALAAAGALLGTALSSAGASALNQWLERDRDALMVRTAHRPLPDGRITPPLALAAGLCLSAIGVLTLLALAGPAPAIIALLTILLYVLVYTPLKPFTPLATLVGTIPGALPPLIGWTAAAAPGAASPESLRDAFVGPAAWGGWSLVVLMIVWQVPHFLAIAWMHREDYARAGYRMLPGDNAEASPGGPGIRVQPVTGAIILLWSAALLPITLAPAMVIPDRLGWIYVAIATLVGVPFLAAAGVLAVRRTRGDARRVFFASIIHLPLVLVAMVADALLGLL
jgi:protoheme IX farnesyltransferase